MKPDNPLKHFVLAFLLALLCYAVSYRAIEHRRVRKGPWQVTFTNLVAGVPEIVVNQPALAITNARLIFPGQAFPSSAVLGTLAFSQPRPVPYDVPFGKCIFMDTTFLPGTLTLNLFGHEIELLPRVLMIDHEEHPWRSEAAITLPPAEGLAK